MNESAIHDRTDPGDHLQIVGMHSGPVTGNREDHGKIFNTLLII